MLRASCLCGGVKYEITGPLARPLNCHCAMCRKAQGAAFRSRAGVRGADLTWVAGEELVKYYESSPGTFRGFCGVCGSPVLSKFVGRGEYGIPLGTLDGDPLVWPELHVFVASKAPWFEITDDLPQFATVPPARS